MASVASARYCSRSALMILRSWTARVTRTATSEYRWAWLRIPSASPGIGSISAASASAAAMSLMSRTLQALGHLAVGVRERLEDLPADRRQVLDLRDELVARVVPVVAELRHAPGQAVVRDHAGERVRVRIGLAQVRRDEVELLGGRVDL